MTSTNFAPTPPAIGFGVTIATPFATALAQATEALKAEGFGVLTTIDVQATLKAKLDIDTPPYTILGACNPALAHRALVAAPEVGLLLPCNVVVRQVADGTRVEAVDPLIMLGVLDQPDLAEVAREAQARLRRVIAALG